MTEGVVSETVRGAQEMCSIERIVRTDIRYTLIPLSVCVDHIAMLD